MKWYSYVIVLLVIIIIILCIILLNSVLHSYYMDDSKNLNNLSYIGQFLSGTVGILISLLVGLIVLSAFLEQRRQIFENNFFNLLSSHERAVNEIDTSQIHRGEKNFNPEFFRGRKVFKQLYDVLSFNYHTNNLNKEYYVRNDTTEPVSQEKKSKLIHLINKSYLDMDLIYQPYIGYYFRNLYYILVLVNSNKILTSNQKRFYINIIRSKISGYELLLLFYNCISIRGSGAFKDLIESYNFFEHISVVDSFLIDRGNVDHKYLYKKSAF